MSLTHLNWISSGAASRIYALEGSTGVIWRWDPALSIIAPEEDRFAEPATFSYAYYVSDQGTTVPVWEGAGVVHFANGRRSRTELRVGLANLSIVKREVERREICLIAHSSEHLSPAENDPKGMIRYSESIDLTAPFPMDDQAALSFYPIKGVTDCIDYVVSSNANCLAVLCDSGKTVSIVNASSMTATRIPLVEARTPFREVFALQGNDFGVVDSGGRPWQLFARKSGRYEVRALLPAGGIAALVAHPFADQLAAVTDSGVLFPVPRNSVGTA